MNSVINEYCTTISNQRQKLCAEELLWLLDLIFRELNQGNNSTAENYSQIIKTLKNTSGLILIDPLVINHQMFSLIQNFFINLLNQWLKEKIDESLFQDIIDLFSKLIKHIKTINTTSSLIFERWFLNELFFQTIASVLNDLTINPNRYLNENHMMESLTALIQSIRRFQNDDDQIRNHPNVLLLVDPIIKCLSSSVYIETLKKHDIQTNYLSSFDEFFLYTISHVIVFGIEEKLNS